MGKFFSSGNAESYSNVIETVKEVLELNVIKLSNGETVKLIGVVPPKTAHPDGIKFLKELATGETVTLEYDKSRQGKNEPVLAFVYLNCGKNFDAIKKTELIDKYSPCFTGFEALDEMGEQPENLIVKDSNGKDAINLDVARTMKPKGDLYLQLNLTLIGCGFADFKSMPPDDCMDELFKSKYREASQNKLGIWNLGN